jgi:curli biogenesis system outer membrane secretion channel CsgG
MFTYQSSPASASGSGASISPSAEYSVAVASFGNPASAPMPWPQLGSTFSDALMQSLRSQDRVEVRGVHAIEGGDRAAAVAAARAMQPSPDYLVLGQVTDFHHTGEIAGGNLQRLGAFGRRNEAIAAVSIEVIDLGSGEIVRSDHLHGTASVPSDLAAAEIYRDLSPRSYLFWSTPLGRAGREAIDDAADAVAGLPDPRGIRLEVVAQSGSREVTIAGGQRAGLAPGDRFTLLSPAGEPVRDALTGEPITAVVLRIERNRATAFLSGEPPRETPLAGMRLGRETQGRQAAAGIENRQR